MKKASVVLFAVWVLAPSLVLAQLVPPCPGVEIPQAYYDRISLDKTAFQFQRAWIQKAQRAKEVREAFLAMPHPEGMTFASLPDDIRKSMMVSGTVSVPLFTGTFANTGDDPYAISELQTKLFSPSPAASMTALYDEMSYGNLTLTGTVYDWITVSQNDIYYEGGCNGICANGHIGGFIMELLVANDPAVNFGIYDNDGPDGIANSGDDDGYVDFVAFVQPETGGECSTSNLWSHRWVVGGWPEFGGTATAYGPPWETNDPRSGGGFIKVWDYTLQPALGSVNGCGDGVIEIGVFCHEFGHAFGLPDFYDTDGGSAGIGHWGLMGSGNWNTPMNPPHMTAYSKAELGWIIPTEVGPFSQAYTVHSSEVTAEAYRLNVMEERFTRKNVSPINGSYSMHCALTSIEASSRNWPGGAGYGNGWNEAVRHDFSYDGADAVTLEYDYAYHTEACCDFGRVKIDVNGAVSILATYGGQGSGHATIDLTPYLNGSGASTYQLVFQFTSDYGFSDEDGDFNSGSDGSFKIDDISVNGGGESYSTGFEMYEDGWYYDRTTNPVKEWFIVENRNISGVQFDQFLHAQGLVIYHVEDDVMKTVLGNTGDGSPGIVTRGMMLEEADGLNHLLNGVNRGDGGDIFPGLTSNTSFSHSTNPNSRSHNNNETRALVENIGSPGTQMSATMRGGHFPPTALSVTPAYSYTDSLVVITDLSGVGFVHGATFVLRDEGHNEYAASAVEWVGKTKITGEVDLSGLPIGFYDVIVRNPDGQESVLPGAFGVASVPVFIQAFDARTTDEGIELNWEIWSDEAIRGFRITRREAGSSVEKNVYDGGLIEPKHRSFVDETVRSATNYEYFLIVVLSDGAELKSQGLSASSAAYTFSLMQNHPNPFNPTTMITFSLPGRTHVTLSVYDARGKRIMALVNEMRPAGMNEVLWDGTNDAGNRVSSGVYFYRLNAAGRVLTKKMLLLK